MTRQAGRGLLGSVCRLDGLDGVLQFMGHGLDAVFLSADLLPASVMPIERLALVVARRAMADGVYSTVGDDWALTGRPR